MNETCGSVVRFGRCIRSVLVVATGRLVYDSCYVVVGFSRCKRLFLVDMV